MLSLSGVSRRSSSGMSEVSMFSSSLMSSEVPGTISSPSDVNRFSDMVEGQAMVRQDRGFDPIVWISSVADYIEMRTDRDGFSVSVRRNGCFPTYLYSWEGSKMLHCYWPFSFSQLR